jgi:hypothetical protein
VPVYVAACVNADATRRDRAGLAYQVSTD